MTEPSRAVFLSYASRDAEAAARIGAPHRPPQFTVIEPRFGIDEAPCLAALNHACRTEADLAFAWLDRAYRQRDGDYRT
jgi:hypothetical protein